MEEISQTNHRGEELSQKIESSAKKLETWQLALEEVKQQQELAQNSISQLDMVSTNGILTRFTPLTIFWL